MINVFLIREKMSYFVYERDLDNIVINFFIYGRKLFIVNFIYKINVDELF